mmetsp:Transcript_37889/g.100922  ORF Transcript_37889/g.100922 Transcript_37889/m.100922 type:complete len:92 (+) Transcript_37889:11-286(+)
MTMESRRFRHPALVEPPPGSRVSGFFVQRLRFPRMDPSRSELSTEQLRAEPTVFEMYERMQGEVAARSDKKNPPKHNLSDSTAFKQGLPEV